jgi:hypothetical protein
VLWVVRSYYVGGRRDVTGPYIKVLRGQEGTTAAAHALGAKYEWLGPPEGA